MFHISEKQIRILKLVFNISFITIIVVQLFLKAVYTLPNKWLLFLTSDALEYFVFAAVAYALYYYVLKQKRLGIKISYILLFISVIAGIALLKSHRIYAEIFLYRAFNYFTEFLGKTLLFYLLIYTLNQLDFLNNYKKMQYELSQAKEQLLRQQLHPHFLFNAFNSLYSLSLKNDPETPEYILKLSSMMRYITDDTQLEKVKISKELDFIEQYIAIEQIRYGKEANIKLTVNDAINKDHLIEPFLFIILVENAFKHGFYTNAKDAYVYISLNLEHNELVFCVENKIFEKQHFQENNRKGKGLDNLRRRLKLLYPNKAILTIKQQEESFTAILKIKMQ